MRRCCGILLAWTWFGMAPLAWAAEMPPAGVYRVVRADVVNEGAVCGIGTPLTPAWLLRMGPVDDPSADDAIGVLVDDAGVAMPIVPAADGTLTVNDASELKGSKIRAIGKIAPGAAPLAVDVHIGRYDLECDVKGTLTFAPSTEPSDATRIERLTRAWLLMGVRDARRAAGDSRAALEPARAAEALFREELGERHRLTAFATGWIASLHKDLDEQVVARKFSEASLAAMTAALGADHVNVLQATNNYALILWELGDLPGAEAHLRHIIDRYATVLKADDGRRLGSLTNLATLLGQRGRFVEAEAILRDVVLRRERVFGPTHPTTIIAINNLASAYAGSGWIDEAVVQARLAYERYVASLGARHPAALRSRNSIAQLSARTGATAAAAAEFREVLALRREIIGPRHNETLVTQANLAGALAEQGALEEALALQREVVAIRGETSGRENVLTLQAEAILARLESQAGDHAAAVARLKRARWLSALTLGAQDRAPVEIAALLGYAQHAAGQLPDARTTLGDVVDAVERWRESGRFTATRRAVLFAPWVRAYKELAFIALGQGDVAAAFDHVERSKARGLVESLALRRGETAAVLPREALETLAALDARISSLETRQSRATGQEERLALAQELATAAEEAATQRARLRARYPRYAALAQPRLVSARAGAAEIAAGTVFVNYLVQGDRVLALTLTRAGRARGHDLGTIAGLDAMVKAYREMLASTGAPPLVWKTPDGRYSTALVAPSGAVQVRDAAEIGAELHARLVRPLYELANVRHWIVSPDGPLALVPFETLPEAGRPLIVKRDIHYAPSLTVHTLTARRGRDYSRARDRAPLYAMGAAYYGSATRASAAADDGGAAAAPRGATAVAPRDGPRSANVDAASVAHALVDDPGAIRRAYDRLGARWPELPASQAEIDAVAQVFKPHGPVTVRTRGDATEARLRADDRSGALARHRYVLLSAHGYLSTESPSLSAVVLGQRDVTPEYDGYVTAAEWTGYTLRSDLIVVSACETGVGRVVEGEGVAGLPYALFVAGNRNALLTLWPVADASTARFVARFFALLRDGRSQSEALAMVKREFATTGRYRAPAYWAPFVLWGS